LSDKQLRLLCQKIKRLSALFLCRNYTLCANLFRTEAPRTGEYASNPERKNTPCFLDLAGVIFSKNGRDIFLFGVLHSKYSGRWRNNADEVLAKTIFWGKDLPKLWLILF